MRGVLAVLGAGALGCASPPGVVETTDATGTSWSSESGGASGTDAAEESSGDETTGEDDGSPGPCDDLECGHGDCVAGSEPMCLCDQGWIGDACDACGDGYVAWAGECIVEPNYIFVSEESFTGAVGLNPGESIIDHARDICQSEAAAAGLPGAFEPVFATPTEVAAPLTLAGSRGWIRPDGLPVVNRFDELVSEDVIAAPVLQADGVRTTREVWTGMVWENTTDEVVLGSDCLGWSSDGGMEDGGTGNPRLLGRITAYRNGSCKTDRSVLCMGTGADVEIRPPLPPSATDRILFVGPTVAPDAGLDGFDAACQEAHDATSPSGPERTFRALVGTLGNTPLSRVGAADARWVRSDGAEVAPTTGNFAAGSWEGFPVLEADGTRATAVYRFSGARQPGDAGEGDDCDGWTDASSIVGIVQRGLIDELRFAGSFFSGGCVSNTPTAVLCAEVRQFRDAGG